MPATLCPYSGLGVYDDGSLPPQPQFKGRCSCGAVIVVDHGRIGEHVKGMDRLALQDGSAWPEE